MSLTTQEQELICVGVSVAAGCKPCTSYHIEEARTVGCAEEALTDAVERGLAARQRAAVVMGLHARKRLGVEIGAQDDGETDDVDGRPADRLGVLIDLGAAFALNCTTSLRGCLSQAETLAVRQDIGWVLEMALFIRGKAASHVQKIADRAAGEPPGEQDEDDAAGGCGCAVSEAA